MLRNATAWKSLVLGALMVGGTSLFAQPANYTAFPVAGTYTPIVGGIVHATGTAIDDQEVTGVNIGFTFTYGPSLTTSTVNVNANGYITIGNALGGTTYTPLSSAVASTQVMSALGRNLRGTAAGEIRTETIGIAPNRTFVVQWSNMTRPSTSGAFDNLSFQIRLNEADGTIDYVYGSVVVKGALGAQIGMRGATNAQVFSMYADYDESTFSQPILSTTTARVSTLEDGFTPTVGQTYRWQRRTVTNDVGVVAIEGPSVFFNANSTQTVTARIRNYGTNVVDSLTIDWRVNGTLRTAVKYYAQPALQPNEERVVTLGTVNFGPRSFNTITAQTLLPNGVADTRTGNNVATAFRAPRVSGSFIVAKTGAPASGFNRLRDLVRHLKVSGINGSIDVVIREGVYEESIVLDGVDATDFSQTFTVRAQEGDDVIVRYPLHSGLNSTYGAFEFPALVNIIVGGNITMDGITFEVDQTSTFNGGILVPGFLSNCSFRNCTFRGLGNQTFSGNAFEVFGTAVFNTEFTNNTFENHRSALVLLPSQMDNVTIQDNVMNVQNGIQLQSAASRVNVLENVITIDNRYTGVGTGIALLNVAANVQRNTINGINARDGVNGILAVVPSGTTTIVNNLIGVAGSSQALGMLLQANSNGTVNVYHNTVNSTAAAAALSAGLYIDNNETTFPTFTVNSVNNIWHNLGTGNMAASTTAYAQWINDVGAVALTSANTPLVAADFNNVISTAQFNSRVNNTAYTTLASYRGALGREQNSASTPVVFVGADNLRLLTIQNALFGAASITPQVSTDIDGNARRRPYMGAHEIAPTIDFVQQPESQYVCQGGNLQLVAIATVTVGSTTTYQWYKDGRALTGRTTAILAFGPVSYDAAGVYTCEVTTTDGLTTVRKMSNEATVMVVRPTSISQQPETTPVAQGGTVNLSVEAEAVGGPANFVPTYQWKKRYWNAVQTRYVDSNLVDDGRITGTQSSVLTIRNVRSSDTADFYVVTVTGFCGEATSRRARLFSPLAVAINNTPAACVNQPLQLEATVTPGAEQGMAVTYQWMKDGSPLVDNGRISGSTTRVLDIPMTTAADNGAYRVMVVFTETETIIESEENIVEIGTAPAITSQPVSDTVCEGEAVTLNAQAEGTAIGFQWMKGGTAIPSATGATYTIQNASLTDAGQYSVMVTNGCGTAASITATILVNAKPEITDAPDNVSIIEAEPFTLTVEAEGTGDVSYQWKRNGEDITGATGATYTVTNAGAADAGTYSVVVSNSCGSVESSAAVVDVTVGVTGDIVMDGYTLTAPMPNPTSGAVRFNVTLPSAQNVRIMLTDVLGNNVATLVNGIMTEGTTPVQFDVASLGLTPGVYSYTVQSAGFTATHQVVVVR